MDLLKNGIYTGERALYNTHNTEIQNSVFEDGESPLKESSDLRIINCDFRWKYPLWYCKNVEVKCSKLEETARSGIWYTDNITFIDSTIEAPKTFRRAKNITLLNTDMPNALESLWGCENISLTNVNAKGDYFGMNTKNVKVENFKLDGNYAFDGGTNIEIRNAVMLSKDSFWNCENVTVYNSTIVGEYLGWNSKNLTFINCTIESNQGMCYIDNIKMVNCKLIKTDLCFEFCNDVDAEIKSNVISIKNPYSGVIKVKDYDELIMDDTLVDVSKTKIIKGE